MLREYGYIEIGMDHFSLPNDELYEAFVEGRLHRNFMGYTDKSTKMNIGLGVSAISDTWNAFAQNEKVLEDYYRRIEIGDIPVFRGHKLTKIDLQMRKYILALMCKGRLNFKKTDLTNELINRLKEFEEDGLIIHENGQLKITKQGRPFIRNINMVFDQRQWESEPSTQLFSTSI